jgi:uncharacterized protein YbjT (DUF2867 family)
MTVLVTGANGFVGRHVVRELLGRDIAVRALVRSRAGADALAGLECDLATGDVTRPERLATAVAGCDAVVHLVAIIAGRPSQFERVIAGGTENLVAAARAAGVRRFVYVSAIGASDPASPDVPYFRAKTAAEAKVVASGLPHTILRPTFVFGPDGGALPRFLRIARLAPATPIVGPGTQRVQPIWVADVARAVALALEHADTRGPTVQLGGPDVVDWTGLWQRLKLAQGTKRPALHLPTWLMLAPALLLERLPNPPLTVDQLRMLGGPDNVVSDDGRSMAELGLGDRVPLDEQLRRAAEAL